MTMRPDDISKTDPIKKIGEDQKSLGGTSGQAPGQSFESYMQQKPMAPGAPGAPTTISPFDLVQGKTPVTAGPSFDTLLSQVKSSQALLGDMNNQLNTKNLKLKQSQRYLLRTKLNDANSHLRAANAKMGVEVPEVPTTAGKGVVGKFLDYVNQGHANLAAAQDQVMKLKDKGASLNPADFLSIQLKLAHAQQEIEYASIMLSKAVEDIKMLFNIQI